MKKNTNAKTPTTKTTTAKPATMREAYAELMKNLRAENDIRKKARALLDKKLAEAWAEYRATVAEVKAGRKTLIDEFNALKAARKTAKKPVVRKAAAKKTAKKAAAKKPAKKAAAKKVAAKAKVEETK